MLPDIQVPLRRRARPAYRSGTSTAARFADQAAGVRHPPECTPLVEGFWDSIAYHTASPSPTSGALALALPAQAAEERAGRPSRGPVAERPTRHGCAVLCACTAWLRPVAEATPRRAFAIEQASRRTRR